MRRIAVIGAGTAYKAVCALIDSKSEVVMLGDSIPAVEEVPNLPEGLLQTRYKVNPPVLSGRAKRRLRRKKKRLNKK